MIDKVAIVTGSTGGIGEGIARALAAEGMSVVISGRRLVEGEQVTQQIRAQGGQALFIQTDLAREQDCAHLVRASVEHFGRLDILVNNAGIFPSVPLMETTADLWDEVFAINVRGAFLCSQAAISSLRQQGGSIINIGSTLAFRSKGERIAYACSKGALLTMTKVLARELLPEHIRVNWITVGWVASPGEIELRNQTNGDGAVYLQERGQMAPLGRLETTEDIAAGVVYLASDAASHVTGCELNISGGLLI
ncbi:MAG: SDR family oxidoreductase [Chloroflexi bacterium]|nr:SDR family oxidoreductase [Chloroflexota bacterium]